MVETGVGGGITIGTNGCRTTSSLYLRKATRARLNGFIAEYGNLQ